MFAAVLAAVLLAGCRSEEPPAARARRTPGVEDVRAAVAALDLAVREALGDSGWPSYLPRSHGDPGRALVRTEEVEDLGRTAADTETLTRALETAVREVAHLRLARDEDAGAPTPRAPGAPLPDDPFAPGGDRALPPRAGLLVQAWIDRRGRVRVTLQDVVTARPIASAASP